MWHSLLWVSVDSWTPTLQIRAKGISLEPRIIGVNSTKTPVNAKIDDALWPASDVKPRLKFESLIGSFKLTSINMGSSSTSILQIVRHIGVNVWLSYSIRQTQVWSLKDWSPNSPGCVYNLCGRPKLIELERSLERCESLKPRESLLRSTSSATFSTKVETHLIDIIIDTMILWCSHCASSLRRGIWLLMKGSHPKHYVSAYCRSRYQICYLPCSCNMRRLLVSTNPRVPCMDQAWM